MPSILVVEDRENWRRAFCDWLKDIRRFEVYEAETAERFKELATKVDVIVLDIQMPAKQGGQEVRDAGLTALHELQQLYPENAAITNPIIRSMWSPEDMKHIAADLRYKQDCWVSRECPLAELEELIDKVLKEQQEG